VTSNQSANDGMLADDPERLRAAMLLVAHELRRPVTVARGYLSMLEDGSLPDVMRHEAFGILWAKLKEIDGLAEVLSTAGRLDAGEMPRIACEFNVADAARQAAARVAPGAKLEGATVEVAVPPGPVLAVADRCQVVRILTNLIENGLTYSRRPAWTRVEVRPSDPVEVVVRDHGVGIPPDRRERVFERFSRPGEVEQRSAAGLGLGLAISRELAELNRGSLTLEHSVPGEGSVFVLRLPCAADDEQRGDAA
jgi:signal transduction histidine kinase